MNQTAQQIRQQISILEVLNRYGFDAGRKGVLLCPFHDEDTPSFKVYRESDTFYCFGCGAGGTVIDFVMRLFHLTFREAVGKLDADFGLHLLQKPTLTKYRKRKAAERKAQEERERQQAIIEYNKTAYFKLAGYYRWLREQPDSPDRTHDMAYLDRLLDQFLGATHYIPIDVDALIPALMTKFESEA